MLDATIPMATGDATGQLKFGLSLRDRHKTNDSYNPVFTPTGTISLAGYTYGPDQIYYGNRYNIGPAINFSAVITLWPIATSGTITDDAAADASTDTDNRENVYAGYGQFTARYGKWGVLAGLRVESTHARYGGNLYDADTDVNTPTAVKTSYTNYFPTLQGRYDILDNLVARATYSSGIARPGFDQIDPGATVSVINATVTVGNPALKPTIGQNFDLTLEYYPGDGQIAAAGCSTSDFKNYILQSQQFVDSYPFPGTHQHDHDGAELLERARACRRLRGAISAAADIPPGAVQRIWLQRQRHLGRFARRNSPGYLRSPAVDVQGHVERGALLRALAHRNPPRCRLRRPESVRFRRRHRQCDR